MKQTPTYLITGFLGSGKTTMIKKLIDYYSGSSNKLGIIQNEFAPANFDGQELKRTTSNTFDILEINNGSVFCVCLLSDFLQSLTKFVSNYHPDILLIETSGLSDPISVGEIFNAEIIQNNGVYLAGSVCIVDAVNFLKLEKMQLRMVHQAQIADHLLINKIDKVVDYSEVLAKLETVNPHGKKHFTSYCDIDPETIFAQKTQNFSNTGIQISAEDIGRPEIFSVVYKTTKPLKKVNLNTFIRLIQENMIRTKGFILLDSGQNISLQQIHGHTEIENIERNIRQTELISMSYHVTVRDFKKMYLELC